MENIYKSLSTFENRFKNSDLWKMMLGTTENSPWHREANVAVHTEMVCQELLDRVYQSNVVTPDELKLAYIACLFHDVGKPAAKVVKFKVDRGYYYAFHGHEQISARMFEDYYMTNKKYFDDWFTIQDAYKVMWMIENHLPYDLAQNDKKMDYLRTAIEGSLGENRSAFGMMLIADAFGRISDDSEQKRKKTVDFVDLLYSANVNEKRHIKPDAPILNLLIGASGSGKSSYTKQLKDLGYAHYSFDDIRIQLAIENGVTENSDPIKMYRDAFAYCDKHRSQFGHRADVEFIKHIKDYSSIVVDNTNTSRKNRAKFVDIAKTRGYNVVATVFPIAKYELLNRMNSRTDKNVPEDAVLRQYMSIAIPWIGVEVDDLIIVCKE